MRLAVVDGELVPAEDAPASTLNVLDIVALALAEGGHWESDVGDLIPQATWDSLHQRGLVATGRDWLGDGYTTITDRGEAELAALVERAAQR